MGIKLRRVFDAHLGQLAHGFLIHPGKIDQPGALEATLQVRQTERVEIWVV